MKGRKTGGEKEEQKPVVKKEKTNWPIEEGETPLTKRGRKKPLDKERMENLTDKERK